MKSAFPRLSMSGLLILAGYVSVQTMLFDKSLYGTAMHSGALQSESSILLNGFTMAASLLNVASHAAVVLGALNDTYVLSILVGVGFDVLTRILQLLWWLHLSRISYDVAPGMDSLSAGFLVVLSTFYGYHMWIHLRALRMNASKERLESVLTGALNNLRGIPGDCYEDHAFAYSDLGSHLLPMILCTHLLHRQHAMVVALWVLLLLILFSYVALSRIPLHRPRMNQRIRAQSLIQTSGNGSIVCNCDACIHKFRRTNQKGSFAFHPTDGVCCLWLCSFESLSTILGNKN